MKKIIFLLKLFTFLIFTSSFAQSSNCFLVAYDKACIYLKQQDTINAQKYLAEAVLYEIPKTAYAGLAYFYLSLRAPVKGFEYYHKSVLYGQIEIVNFPLAESYTEYYLTFLQEHPKLVKQFAANVNIALYTIVQQMYARDVHTRWHAKMAVEYDIVDSVNMVELRSMVAKNGRLPICEEIGIDAMGNLSTILLHCSGYDAYWSEIEKWVKPLLETADFSGMDYAMMVDRRCAIKKEPLVYGVLAFPGQKIDELIDIQNVDKRRLLIRLEPLFYAAKSRGLKLPNGYIYDDNITSSIKNRKCN